MVRKEWLMMSLVALLTLLCALWILRWLAPGLLGVPADLQLVSTSEKVPPFYDNIFRAQDRQSAEFILRDPMVVNRAKPLFPDINGMGPNDILGFRNRDVPNVADIVTIGDSQTYGNNAPLEQNWPSYLQEFLSRERPLRVYNMSVGAWSAVHYFEILKHALRFRPRVVVIAFYTGNDPLLDFSSAYGNDRWSRFRPDPNLAPSDAPKVEYPPPEDEIWRAQFLDGSDIHFTPNYRFQPNNRDEVAVRAGYQVMSRVAAEIRDLVLSAQALPVFTIVPTKELVYSERLLKEAATDMDDVYLKLVHDEKQNIEELADDLAALKGAMYVDIVKPLMLAADQNADLYPRNANGHPVAAGYRVIAEALSERIEARIPPPLRGLYGVRGEGADTVTAYLVNDSGKWLVPDPRIALANGWGEGDSVEISVVSERDITAIPTLGILTKKDPERFGPDAFR